MQRGQGTGGASGQVDVDRADPATGEHLPGPRVGELPVRSPIAFLGYWRDSAVTDRAVRGGCRRELRTDDPADVR